MYIYIHGEARNIAAKRREILFRNVENFCRNLIENKKKTRSLANPAV